MLIPISDDNQGRLLTPYMVYLIIALNAIVFLVFQQAGTRGGDEFTYGYSAIPYEITHNVDLVKPQQIGTPRGVVVIQEAPGPSPIWLTIFTSMFMHGG